MQTDNIIRPGIKFVKQEYWDAEYQEFEEQKHILDEYHEDVEGRDKCEKKMVWDFHSEEKYGSFTHRSSLWKYADYVTNPWLLIDSDDCSLVEDPEFLESLVVLELGGTNIVVLPMYMNLFFAELLGQKIKFTSNKIKVPLVLFHMIQYKTFPITILAWHEAVIRSTFDYPALKLECYYGFDRKLYNKMVIQNGVMTWKTIMVQPSHQFLCFKSESKSILKATNFYNFIHPTQLIICKFRVWPGEPKEEYLEPDIIRVELDLGVTKMVFSDDNDLLIRINMDNNETVYGLPMCPEIRSVDDIKYCFLSEHKKHAKLSKLSKSGWDNAVLLNRHSTLKFYLDNEYSNFYLDIYFIQINELRSASGMIALGYST